VEYATITASVQDDLDAVERVIVENLGSEVPLIPRVGDYVFSSGGKRFRPALLLLSARLAGYRGPRAHNLAAVIEFVHTASLLHDDVVDNARMRRGRESANRVFGNEASVLVGDFIYGRASSMLADDRDIRTVKVVAEALRAMAEGEVMQLGRQQDINTTESDYLEVIERKTAVLISAASELGAILGECDDGAREALRRFGLGPSSSWTTPSTMSATSGASARSTATISRRERSPFPSSGRSGPAPRASARPSTRSSRPSRSPRQISRP
jgi:octaprenyl-diphosphate synthase